MNALLKYQREKDCYVVWWCDCATVDIFWMYGRMSEQKYIQEQQDSERKFGPAFLLLLIKI